MERDTSIYATCRPESDFSTRCTKNSHRRLAEDVAICLQGVPCEWLNAVPWLGRAESIKQKRALPHFYNHPIIITREALYQFSERLVQDASLGLHLRTLFLWLESLDEPDMEIDEPADDPDMEIDEPADDPDIGIGEPADGHDKVILNIISRAPQLRRVYGADFQRSTRGLQFLFSFSGLSWEGFCLMADTAGSSLIAFENVSIYGTERLYTPCPLYSFTALQSLFWDCVIKFNVDDGVVLKDCFQRLESLQISRCDPSFLELLMHIE
jgi:hypothetical protein